MKYCFGIDIGGTTIKMGLFHGEGKLLDKWEIETKTENAGEAILPDIAKAIGEKQKEYGISNEEIFAIGVGVPAAVVGEGIVESTTNLGWGYKDVKGELTKLSGHHVLVENDANVAALGEMWKGAGMGHENLIMVTLGTGVGGGIIMNGQLLTGVKGGAGEIGEILADYELTENGEKIFRNLEYYVSATGIVRMAKKRLKNNTSKTKLTAENVTAKAVFDAVKKEDEVAMEIADRFGCYLGQALDNLAVTLEPEMFVIGGGVSKAGNVLLEVIKKYYHNSNSKLALATLGNDAGIYGAARMALEIKTW